MSIHTHTMHYARDPYERLASTTDADQAITTIETKDAKIPHRHTERVNNYNIL